MIGRYAICIRLSVLPEEYAEKWPSLLEKKSLSISSNSLIEHETLRRLYIVEAKWIVHQNRFCVNLPKINHHIRMLQSTVHPL